MFFFEANFVIAGRGRFGGFIESRSIAGLAVGAVVKQDLAGKRHQQHIAIVGNAGAAEVGMAESIHNRIGKMIAGAAVPAIEARVGTELYHAEREGRTGISVTVRAGSDKRIDELGEVVIGGNCRRRAVAGKTEQHGKSDNI